MKNTRSRELISFLQQIIFIFLQKIIYNYIVTHWKTFCYLKVTILPNNEPTCILTLTGDYTDLANTMEKGIRISGCEASEIWLLISQNWRNLFFSFFCYFRSHFAFVPSVVAVFDLRCSSFSFSIKFYDQIKGGIISPQI